MPRFLDVEDILVLFLAFSFLLAWNIGRVLEVSEQVFDFLLNEVISFFKRYGFVTILYAFINAFQMKVISAFFYKPIDFIDEPCLVRLLIFDN